MDENEEMIESVKKMKKQEKQFKKEALTKTERKHGQFTAKHEEAAKLLIQHLRNFVRRKKLEKGMQVKRYTIDELEEIDRKLMEQFKKLAGVTTVEEEANPPSSKEKDGVPEIL